MKRKMLVWLMVLFFAAGMLAGCGNGDGASEGSNGDESELVVAILDPPPYMDPHVQASIATYTVTTQIFDRLVHMDTDMNFVPKLAESWEVESPTTTVFNLREGVKFHNGEEMTAEDVKYSLERCIASDGVNYNYLIIEDIEVVDDYTIKLTTDEPFNALLYRLTLDAASIMSKTAAEKGDDEFNKNPVGAGPFKFVSQDLGGDVVLEAFDDYWDGKPQVDKVIFRPIPEALNRTVGLETGELDLSYELAMTDLAMVEENEDLVLKQVPSATVWYLGFNVEKPYLSDPLVRQAIAYAIDKEDLVDIVFDGEATLTKNTMLTSKLFGHEPPSKQYEQDIEKAKELMAQAGYEDGFKTSIWFASGQIARDSAVVIQEQLRQIGIEVEVKSMDQGKYYSETGKGEQDMFFQSKTSIDPDSMLRALYHSEAFGLSGNRSFWATEEVDSKLDVAVSTTDEDESAELYAEIQEIIAEEMPLVPIAIQHLNAGMQDEVKGFELYPGKSHYIYGTYIEE